MGNTRSFTNKFNALHKNMGMQLNDKGYFESPKKKKNKYNNRKTVVDGIKFDSSGESERYEELKLLQKNKIIQNLERQKSFELQPHFEYNGKMERSIVYKADFYYYNNELGQIVVEEFKGMETETFKIKRKMLLKNVIIPNNYCYLQTGTKFR